MPADDFDAVSQRRERNLADLVQRLAEEIEALARVELRLARMEAMAYAGRWAGAVALLWTGSLLITALVVVLALAAAMQLAPLFGSIGLAAAAVCAGLFALALAVGLAARSLIRPPRTPTGAIMRWVLTDGERDGPRA